MATLNELRDEALRIATEHGFTDATFAEEIALMHSELSEALEDFRAGKAPGDHDYDWSRALNVSSVVQGCEEKLRWHTLPKPTGIPSELADVIIRVLHAAGKYGIDIERAVAEKMAYNEARPFKHGKVL